MLEMFFDEEKSFTVFKKILENVSPDNCEVCLPKILFDLRIPVESAAEILQSFVFLGIVEEMDDTWETGMFRFNPASPVVLAICSLDEVIGKYVFKELENKILGDGDDDRVPEELKGLFDL